MPKIMVVDDDAEATQLLESILQQQGYETVAVNDSRQAMQTAAFERPDMFLLDLMMPEIDGFKLCRMLRGHRDFFFTPILIVTALNDNDSRVVAFGAGANDYLAKPYHARDLMAKIKELFQQEEDEA
ncbi:MAG: response regulator transcription factor [Anaerolineales bacterium]|nr:response regulator transcription factor [Anaerolineales bacterium]